MSFDLSTYFFFDHTLSPENHQQLPLREKSKAQSNFEPSQILPKTLSLLL